jgi:hypothetical protein
MTTPANHPSRCAALALAALACVPPPAAPDLPLCPALEVASPDGAPPPAALWLSLLLPGYDPERPRVPAPPRTCAGDPVAPPADPCDPATPSVTPVDPLDDRALVFGDVGDGNLLVWAMTHRSAAGDALGPVALVRHSSAAIAVQALGILEAPPNGPILSLLTAGAGPTARRYLVAEGERCPAADACVREARILALDGPRFVPSAYYDANARCIDPPRLPLLRRLPVPGPDADAVVDRRLVAADDHGLYVHEQLELFAGERLLRRAEETRRIEFRDGRLVVDAPSLWSRLSAHLPHGEPPA